MFYALMMEINGYKNISGVFSTEDKAEKALAHLSNDWHFECHDFYILELEMDYYENGKYHID